MIGSADISEGNSQRMAVYLPFAVLTAISVAILAFVLVQSPMTNPMVMAGLASGALLYAVAIMVFGRRGLRNIDKLELLSLTDSLSLLPNRRALHADAKRLRSEAAEVALALIDLDGFKLVNDNYGHFIGDRVIKASAEMLSDIFGQDARIYRLGGDEFAIMMHGPIAGNLLEGLCRKLLIYMTKPIYIDDRAIVLGASIGLTRCVNGEVLNSSELLRRADVAMYVSKRAGKMRCTWFNEEFDSNRILLRELDREMRDALNNDEFRMHYQPLVDARTQEIVAVEALIRWERPDGKKMGPNVFIPIAEESGLINAIGMWVLRQACTDGLKWDDIKLSINVSAAQLRNPEFPIQLGNLLEELDFPPARLELEITETHLVIDSVVAARALELLRDFGIRIVLDDFGTGYASIGFLKQFRFEKLKLDRSLIVDAIKDDGSRAMMLASVTVARSLNMDITAEGVETEEQAALARSAGCDQLQGWLYYKAITAAELDEVLTLDRASFAKVIRRA